MKSDKLGSSTSAVEVSNVSSNGFRLLLGEREVFLPFEDFPWFREATIGQLLNVERPASHHLYWPELDVDLSVESIDHPDRFPLVSKVVPGKGESRAGMPAPHAASHPADRPSSHGPTNSSRSRSWSIRQMWPYPSRIFNVACGTRSAMKRASRTEGTSLS